MNDTWFKVIDFLQANLWWGVGGSAGSFFLLLFLILIIPGKKKKTKKVTKKATSKVEHGEPELDEDTPESVMEAMAEYQATLDSKQQEIDEKTQQIEALDELIEERSADLNVLEEVPEELEERIVTTKKNIHNRYYWYGFWTSLGIAALAFGAYYFFMVMGGSLNF